MKKHRKAPTSEQKAAAQARRADLLARTLPLQTARKFGLLPWAELPTINACLELIYASETGQTEWKTSSDGKKPDAPWQKEKKGSRLGPANRVRGGTPTGSGRWKLISTACKSDAHQNRSVFDQWGRITS